ncbi:MAG: M20 family metallopeptidase [Firmicutes bacterium]|nr:M20 family metallopeptidase [Bacillota bacterium]
MTPDEREALALLERLVNLDTPSGERAGILAAGELLAGELRALRMEMETIVDPSGGLHFKAAIGKGPEVILLAHLDTVFPKGTAAERPFRIEGERAYGPGVSDCKSGVVTVLGALRRLEAGGWPALRLVCFFNSDEELGSPGSRLYFAEMAGGAAAALVVEPARGEELITVSRQGIGRFTLRVFGKAAHSGSDYAEGRSAVLELAHKIIAVHLTDLGAGVTLNVGVISGGIRPNVVPDLATAEIDLRVTEEGQIGPAVAALERIAMESSVPGTSASLSGGITRPPLPPKEANLKLYRRIEEVGRRLGMDLKPFHSGGGSDANLLAASGVPVLDGLGPAGGGHHSEAEYMSIPSLHRRIELLAEFLRALAWAAQSR